MRRRLLVSICIGILAGCGSSAPTGQPTPTAAETIPLPSPSAAVPTSPAPATPSAALVGKWSLNRTCAALVQAVTAGGHPELMPAILSELISPTAAFDPKDPCAHALPPMKHSHTFWPDGTFNSYDQREQEVDFGVWVLVDSDTMKIGEPVADAEFSWVVNGDHLSLTPVIDASCTTAECLDRIDWQFAVAFPGETWTRATSGAHVP